MNKSVQGFLTVTYGQEVWSEIAEDAGIPFEGFEAMLSYADHLTDTLLESACKHLCRDENSLLEDIGTYIVTDPKLESVRRLMRFGGPSFSDFILSLDELQDRCAIAVPDLILPIIELKDGGGGRYSLRTKWSRSGAVALITGVVNAMADDYGALVVLHAGTVSNLAGCVEETLEVFLADHNFTAGRSFLLGGIAP